MIQVGFWTARKLRRSAVAAYLIQEIEGATKEVYSKYGAVPKPTRLVPVTKPGATAMMQWI